jgi:hypothetical protein
MVLLVSRAAVVWESAVSSWCKAATEHGDSTPSARECFLGMFPGARQVCLAAVLCYCWFMLAELVGYLLERCVVSVDAVSPVLW